MPNDKDLQTALVIIDVQRALFERSVQVFHAETFLQNICTLMNLAHESNIPVFIFRHANKSYLARGSEGWQLHTSLEPAASDILLDKQYGSAFRDTDFEQMLQKRNIRRIVVAGLVTNGCIKATCNDAIKRGYHITLVKDAHSSFHKDAATIIEEYNHRLSEQGMGVVDTQAIQF